MLRRGFLGSLFGGLFGFRASRATAESQRGSTLHFDFGNIDAVAMEPHEVEFSCLGETWCHSADTLAGAEGYVRATVAAFSGRTGLTHTITPLRIAQRERLLEWKANQTRPSDSN